jgi:prepilin-type N-terminal cleavage/methylation domain-containing protein
MMPTTPIACARRTRLLARGFTLVELMLTIAVVAILATPAAPGVRDFILTQRLKALNAQLVTDLQFARSEAAARGHRVRLSFRADAAQTCYAISTAPDGIEDTFCDCRLGAGSACTGSLREIRTGQVPTNDSSRLDASTAGGRAADFAFDHLSGAIVNLPSASPQPSLTAVRVESSIDGSRLLRTAVGLSGRVQVCAPASLAVGAPAC